MSEGNSLDSFSVQSLKKVLRLESVVITMNTWKWFKDDRFKTKDL